jgi:DNA-binding response OmpR family regulator
MGLLVKVILINRKWVINGGITMKILVVDSHLETRTSLKEYLEKWGYEVVLAKQGYEALKIIEKTRLDVVLIEADLSGLSGYEICHKIRHKEETSNLAVVLLVADNSRENKIHGYEVGTDAFLAKPILVKELKALLNYFLKRKSKFKNTELCSEVAKTISELLKIVLGEKNRIFPRINYYDRLVNSLDLDPSTNERLKIVDCLYSKKWVSKIGEENRGKALGNLKMAKWLMPVLIYLYEYKNKDSKKNIPVINGIDFGVEVDILIIMMSFFELKDDGLNNCEAIKILRVEAEKMGYNEKVLDKLEEIAKAEDLLTTLNVE